MMITAIALWLAIWLVPGIEHSGPVTSLLGVAIVFGAVNAVLKPLLTVLTCPLIVVTLGLFTLVLNAMLLLATAWVASKLGFAFTVAGFWPAFWGGMVVGLAGTTITILSGSQRELERA
jgi:putative membrane protein